MVGVATEGEADEEANKEHASAVCCSRSFPSGAFRRWQSWDAVIGGGGRPLFFEEVVVEEVEAGEALFVVVVCSPRAHLVDGRVRMQQLVLKVVPFS